MQHQAGVEEAGFALRRPRAGDLEQEVGRQPELGVGFPGRPAPPCCLVGGDQNGLLGGQPGCLAQVRPGLVGAGVRVVGAGQRDQAAQRLHRLLAAGHLGQGARGQLAERAPGRDLAAVAVQLGAARRRPALQQVGDLLERRGAGELVDVVAAVEQAARLAVYVTERRRRGNDIGQSPGRLSGHMSSSRTARSAVYLRAFCAFALAVPRSRPLPAQAAVGFARPAPVPGELCSESGAL